MDKPRFKILTLFLIVLTAVAILVFVFNNKQNDSQKVSLPDSFAAPVQNTKSSETTEEVVAPDGNKTLTMKKVVEGESSTYTFSISDTTGSRSIIFTKSVSAGSEITIPYNTFSPDNKYIFLKESDSSKISYLVLTTSGTPISGDKQTIDVASEFTDKVSKDATPVVTGWADPTLLIVNTDKMSYWFDLSNSSFVPLSTYFH